MVGTHGKRFSGIMSCCYAQGLHMSTDEQLSNLVTRWEDARRHGQAPTAEELCRDTPALVDDLKQCIETLTQTLVNPPPVARPAPPETRVSVAPPTLGPAPAPAHAIAVPGYEILEELGRGGMGIVFKARQVKANRVVALKMILSRAHASLEQKVRFQIEAEAIARLQHPNIVQLHEVGEHDGLPFFSLEYCDGGSLDKKTSGQPLPFREAAELIEKLARAVHYAHSRGVVHRDLKPANILLVSGGVVSGESSSPAAHDSSLTTHHPKITDFGLAKQMDAGSDVSRTGAVLGTPSYMAPEQAQGKVHAVGPPVDIHALGTILYEFLTGRPPFRGDSALDTMRRVMNDEPIPPSRLRPGTPRDLETICLKCLRKPPALRYATAEALAEDLHHYLAGEPISARRVGRLERAAMWMRRRPAIAALLILLFLVVDVAVGLITWKWRQEASAHAEAVTQRREAEDARDRAEASLYLNAIGAAEREYLGGSAERALGVLEACRPELRRWEWHYLRRVILSQVYSRPRRGSTSEGDVPPEGWNDFVRAGRASLPRLDHALSPDRTRLAWPRSDGSVMLLDTASGAETRRLKTGGGSVEDAAFSPDGKFVAAACWDHTVRVFNSATGELLWTGTGHSAPVTAVIFSPDGQQVISASRDATIKVWDATSGKAVQTLLPTNGSTTVAVSRDGTLLAAGGYRNATNVWDLKTGKIVLELAHHREPVRAVAFSDDGSVLATAGDDRTVKLFSLQKGDKFGVELTAFRGHTGSVSHLAFHPAGKFLASCSGDPTNGEIRVWDLKGWREVRYLARYPGEIVQTTFTKGKHTALTLVTGPAGSEVHVLDTIANKPLARFREDGTVIQSTGADTEGRFVALSLGRPDRPDDRFAVKVCQVADGKEVLALHYPGKIAHAIALSPDGSRLATASLDGELKVWAVPSGTETASFRLDGDSKRPPRPHQGPNSATFSVDCRRLGAVNADGTIGVWDLTTGKELQRFSGHGGRIYSLTFSPNGRLLASAADVDPHDRTDPTLKVWDVENGGEAYQLRGVMGDQRGIAFTPDGSRLASAGELGVTTLWEASTGRFVFELRDVAYPIDDIAFSPDGVFLLTGEKNGSLILWDATPAP
jgi:WD40 repeat protein/tRNA A-37 threonylcarbamoyl transferase component Bud32